MTQQNTPESAITVIILTHNEEANIAQAIGSVAGWANQICIVDSYSSDMTLEIVRKYHCTIVQHQFENYASQRNFALATLPIEAGWVFFLDADEWCTQDLKNEISSVISQNGQVNGYYMRFRLIWLNKWIRRGYYPTWILRLARYGKMKCDDRPLGEHFIVEGEKGFLKNDIIHEDRKGISEWISKHNRYAELEAHELLASRYLRREIPPSLVGNQAQRKRWLRYHVWNRFPPLVRPILYYVYRYVLRGGFLDGVPGFCYHFLHALWFQMLIDIKYLELRRNRGECSRK